MVQTSENLSVSKWIGFYHCSSISIRSHRKLWPIGKSYLTLITVESRVSDKSLTPGCPSSRISSFAVVTVLRKASCACCSRLQLGIRVINVIQSLFLQKKRVFFSFHCSIFKLLFKFFRGIILFCTRSCEAWTTGRVTCWCFASEAQQLVAFPSQKR